MGVGQLLPAEKSESERDMMQQVTMHIDDILRMLKSESFRQSFPHENKKKRLKKDVRISPHLGSMPQISLAYSAIVLSELNLPALGKMSVICISEEILVNFVQSFKVIEPGDVHDGHLRPFCLVSNFISIDS